MKGTHAKSPNASINPTKIGIKRRRIFSKKENQKENQKEREIDSATEWENGSDGKTD